MLPRSLNELYENLRDLWVAVENNQIIACCALHVSWDNLAEIKSLAVKKNKQRKGEFCLNFGKFRASDNYYT